ncbi:MAG: hypothetical protein ABI876_15670 [Bacteroidota bacterium]
MRILLQIIIVAQTLFLCGCFGAKLSGSLGVSQSKSESKRRGVFVASYLPDTNPCQVNDSIRIMVKDAWLEHVWAYGEDLQDTYIFTPYQASDAVFQLVVISRRSDLKDMTETWTIGNNAKDRFRFHNSLRNSMVASLTQMPQNDTIRYMVQNGWIWQNSKPQPIGNFTLIRNGSGN